VDARLLEINLGEWQGRRLAEMSGDDAALYRAWEIDPISAPLPSAETLSSALERVAPALERMLQERSGVSIAVVTHSIIGRVALSHLLGSGVTLVTRLRIKQGSVSKLRTEHGRMVLERLSDTAHLRPR
jgi:broad specificity phosphatase PhoE